MFKKMIMLMICLLLLSVNGWAYDKSEIEEYSGKIVIIHIYNEITSQVNTIIGRVIDIVDIKDKKTRTFVTLLTIKKEITTLSIDWIASIKEYIE